MTSIERIRIRKLTNPGSYTAKGEIIRDAGDGPRYDGDFWGRVDFVHLGLAGRVYEILLSDFAAPDRRNNTHRSIRVQLGLDREKANEDARKLLRFAMKQSGMGSNDFRECMHLAAKARRELDVPAPTRSSGGPQASGYRKGY